MAPVRNVVERQERTRMKCHTAEIDVCAEDLRSLCVNSLKWQGMRTKRMDRQTWHSSERSERRDGEHDGAPIPLAPTRSVMNMRERADQSREPPRCVHASDAGGKHMLSYRSTDWLDWSAHHVRMCIRVADVRIYVVARI
jgi:hypothetical protein